MDMLCQRVDILIEDIHEDQTQALSKTNRSKTKEPQVTFFVDMSKLSKTKNEWKHVSKLNLLNSKNHN